MGGQSRDVVVAGGGIIGASIAWRLSQAGAAVALLDAGVLGGEASWAGAGMLSPGGEYSGPGPWADFALQSYRIYPAFVAELESETGVQIDYRQCGAIEIAHTAAERDELTARRAAQSSMGISSKITNDGVFYPDEALVDPRDVMRALACACRARGVWIIEHSRASQVRIGMDVQVDAGGGPLHAAAVVIAAGAWSGEIPMFRGSERIAIPPSFPVRGHLLGYTLPAGSMNAILRHGHTYIAQRSNGFTIAGTSSEQAGFDRSIDARIVADIRARAEALEPRLREAGDPIAWLGFRPAIAGFAPAIGRLQNLPIWLAYGHYRNGILMAPLTAERIAGEMRPLFRPAREDGL